MASSRAIAVAAIALAGTSACAAPLGIGAFERALAAHHSATEALTQWCRQRGMAHPPVIVARAMPGEVRSADDATRRLLVVGDDEPVRYRRVELVCGETVLSVADNWYVPGRLNPEINHLLKTSDVPFGRAVAPLGYTREQISSHRGRAGHCPRGTILSVRALLKRLDGEPISMVAECYTAANLAPA